MGSFIRLKCTADWK